MKRIALILISIVLAGTMLSALAGCKRNDEQVIRDCISSEFDEVTKADSELWKIGLKTAVEALDTMGVPFQELFSVWTDGYKYEITSVKIDGDTAAVEVKVTCKQFNPAVAIAQDTIVHVPDVNNKPVDEVQALYGAEIMSELTAAAPVTTTISITCTKADNTWSIEGDIFEDISQALLGAQ